MPQEPVCRKVVPAKYKRATAHSIYAEKNGVTGIRHLTGM